MAVIRDTDGYLSTSRNTTEFNLTLYGINGRGPILPGDG
jgi:hypothetical protein